MDTQTPQTAPLVRPWWREPMLWLVIGGPAMVVVASFVTLALVLARPDPLVSENYYKEGLDINKTMHRPAEDVAAGDAHRPAMDARNHAATPSPVRAGATH